MQQIHNYYSYYGPTAAINNSANTDYDNIYLEPLPYQYHLPPSPSPPPSFSPIPTSMSPPYYWSGDASHSRTTVAAGNVTENKPSNTATATDRCYHGCNSSINNNRDVTPKTSNKNQQQRQQQPPIIIKKQKKSVHFQPYVDIVCMPVPPASDMTEQEKLDIWYTNEEFDSFKQSSAKDAGVKLIRNPNFGKYNQDLENIAGTKLPYIMEGNYDDDISQGSSNNNNSNNNADDGTFKNNFISQKEYDDNDDEKQTCKRGLGYHFSCTRKRNKNYVRSAVLEWQKTIRERALVAEAQKSKKGLEPSSSVSSLSGSEHVSNSNNKNSSSSSSKEGKDGNAKKISKNHSLPMKRIKSRVRYPPLDSKSQLILALVSNKCTRNARDAAEWRGRMDYKVAYPERHQFSSPSASASPVGRDEFQHAAATPATAATYFTTHSVQSRSEYQYDGGIDVHNASSIAYGTEFETAPKKRHNEQHHNHDAVARSIDYPVRNFPNDNRDSGNEACRDSKRQRCGDNDDDVTGNNSSKSKRAMAASPSSFQFFASVFGIAEI